MQGTIQTLERLNSITKLPLSLVRGSGELLSTWPQMSSDALVEGVGITVIDDFVQRGRDEAHPLITFLDPGFLLGVIELNPDLYIMIGLVSPYRHSREDVLRMVSEAIHTAHLQQYYEYLLNQPLVSLEMMRDAICLASKLLDMEVQEENILFVDLSTARKLGDTMLDQSLIDQRSDPEFHVPLDFETAIVSAVEAGNRVLLERALFAPMQGRIGRMSSNDLRQQKYAFICMAMLASRASIRGGLPAETAFSLSDLYCQRADLLMEIPLIQNLTFTMLMDFCGRVREIRKQPATSSLVGMCLDYISVHLHEPIGIEQLARHCGLCSRSLSMRFREEMGMGIPEYIHREKLHEADYLLKNTSLSLAEISSFLNYPSQSYFTQVFKRYRGTTPQRYRDS